MSLCLPLTLPPLALFVCFPPSPDDTMAAGDDEPMPDASVAKPRRRFAPQLVEESVRSSNNMDERRRAAQESSEQTPSHDEPMPDAPTAKPRRRFAPQLVEETTKSSNKNTNRGETQPVRTTRDASVQVDDTDMVDAPPAQEKPPRRRFAPVPIETTFDSYRVNKNPHGPTAELTPDPSPTSSQTPSRVPSVDEKQPAVQKPKRRFAPQLIETSRRARKAGQDGPATKHTDKTDITPGTKHIYLAKTKIRAAAPSRNSTASSVPGAEDDLPSRFVPPRRQGSMKPHPNTRRSTPRSSFHPDLDTIASSESEPSSSSDTEDETPKSISVSTTVSVDAPAQAEPEGDSWESRHVELRQRRESCDEDVSGYLLAVAASEARRQREIEQAMSAFPNGVPVEGVEHFFVRESSEDDHYDPEEPPRHGVSRLIRRKSTDIGWAVKEMRQYAENNKQQTQTKQQTQPKQRTAGSLMSTDDEFEHIEDIAPPPEDPLWTTAARPGTSSSKVSESPRVGAPVGSRQPEVPGFRSGPFGNPFATFNQIPQDKDDRELRRMRNAASPPMLGSDLTFRTCPSPKLTRLEPDHPWPIHGDRAEEQNRDQSEETGLWRGYCIAQGSEEMVPSILQAPQLMATPGEPLSPSDPFAAAFTSSMALSETDSPQSLATPAKRHSKNGGIQLLPGLDERLKKAKLRKELEIRIHTEFNDAFITQVYNYLSLGYPAMAWVFDDELSKITGVSVEELRRNDDNKIEKGFMLEMELMVGLGGDGSDDNGSGADEMVTPEEDERRSAKKMPPRWVALKKYIFEWARQHPDLESNGITGWGVRARRGSWAI